MSEQLQGKTFETLVIAKEIKLKAVELNEAEEMFHLVDRNREYLAKYLPWVNETRNQDDSLEFIKKVQKDRSEGSEYGFGIYYQEVLVGHASLMHVIDEELPEIGYWVSEDVSGRGIVTRVAGSLTEFGMDTLGLDQIVIKARPDNIGSNKVAENLDYQLRNTEEVNDEIHNVWRKINE